MFKFKFSIKTLIFVLAVVVLIVCGTFWFLQPKELTPTKVESTLVTFVDRGLDEEFKLKLQQKIDDLQNSLDNNDESAKDINQLLILANTKYMIGDLAGAKEVYEAMLLDYPNDAPALENLGQNLYEMGDFSGAEENWRAALVVNPWEVTYLKLVRLIKEKFPSQQAEIQTILEEAIVNLGQSPGLLIALGDWYADNGDFERAISHYKVAKQLDPSEKTIDEKISETKIKITATE